MSAAGRYMSAAGTFTGTGQSWRSAFLNSPGTPGSNFSYTTPAIPDGAYTVRARAVDNYGQVQPVPRRQLANPVAQGLRCGQVHRTPPGRNSFYRTIL